MLLRLDDLKCACIDKADGIVLVSNRNVVAVWAPANVYIFSFGFYNRSALASYSLLDTKSPASLDVSLYTHTAGPRFSLFYHTTLSPVYLGASDPSLVDQHCLYAL